jgi:hypothetical protein
MMPVKRMKSLSAVSYARRFAWLPRLANHFISGGTSVRPWKAAAVSNRSPDGAVAAGRVGQFMDNSA